MLGQWQLLRGRQGGHDPGYALCFSFMCGFNRKMQGTILRHDNFNVEE